MKRSVVFILTVAVLLGLCACGTAHSPETTHSAEQLLTETTVQTEPAPETADFIVPEPMQRKEYTVSAEPTSQELRQTAVQAMRDMLTVQWSVGRFYTYQKAAAVSEKAFSHIPKNIYAGLPYTNGNSSLIQWFEYYDPETGRLTLEGDTQQMNVLVGNSCAGCVSAGWCAAVDSVYGSCNVKDMVYKNGFLPVGPYTYDTSIQTYDELPTDEICALNGEQTMMLSYAQILPADALVSNPDNHAIMAVEAASVVYKADGSIDPDKSYVAIQDQRGGDGDIFYVEEKDGNTIHYSGRTYYEYTFRQLWELCYIPCTAQAFVDAQAYNAPVISFSKVDCQSTQDLVGGQITSNFPICVAKMILVDDQGNETLVERVMLDKLDIGTGVARAFPLSQFSVSPVSAYFRDMMEEGRTYTLRYDVTISNGQVYSPIELSVTR